MGNVVHEKSVIKSDGTWWGDSRIRISRRKGSQGFIVIFMSVLR